jgi:hypothetical protein
VTREQPDLIFDTLEKSCGSYTLDEHRAIMARALAPEELTSEAINFVFDTLKSRCGCEPFQREREIVIAKLTYEDLV